MKNLTQNISKYQSELAKIDVELEKLPQGYLSKRGKSFYQAVKRKDTTITRNQQLIRQLCRKKYLLARKEQLRNNLDFFLADPSKIDYRTAQELIATFSKAYQELPISYFYHPAVTKWSAADYQKHPYPPEDGYHITKNGVKVRSKSELLIATELESQNIPYRYEAVRMVENKKEYPDFTICNPFNGKIILWEHFGALQIPDYEKKMNEKMDAYLRNNYVPNDTLIYTFEFQVRNAGRVQELIENVILY